MIKYTWNSILETFDLIKKMINIGDVIIQLSYIAYIIYRLVNNIAIAYINIALLVLSLGYLLYHLITIREFYTEEELKQKTIIKRVMKAVKYIMNLYVIVIGLYYISQNTETNMTILMVMIMIVAFFVGIMFDIIVFLIDNQIKLIKYSAYYDVEVFKNKHSKMAFLATFINKEFEDVPTVPNEKIKTKIENIYYKQKNKSMRKKHFKILKGKIKNPKRK